MRTLISVLPIPEVVNKLQGLPIDKYKACSTPRIISCYCYGCAGYEDLYVNTERPELRDKCSKCSCLLYST
jgi:hypothetical protein